MVDADEIGPFPHFQAAGGGLLPHDVGAVDGVGFDGCFAGRDLLRSPAQGVLDTPERIERAHVPVAAQGNAGAGIFEIFEGDDGVGAVRADEVDVFIPVLRLRPPARHLQVGGHIQIGEARIVSFVHDLQVGDAVARAEVAVLGAGEGHGIQSFRGPAIADGVDVEVVAEWLEGGDEVGKPVHLDVVETGIEGQSPVVLIRFVQGGGGVDGDAVGIDLHLIDAQHGIVVGIQVDERGDLAGIIQFGVYPGLQDHAAGKQAAVAHRLPGVHVIAQQVGAGLAGRGDAVFGHERQTVVQESVEVLGIDLRRGSQGLVEDEVAGIVEQDADGLAVAGMPDDVSAFRIGRGGIDAGHLQRFRVDPKGVGGFLADSHRHIGEGGVERKTRHRAIFQEGKNGVPVG